MTATGHDILSRLLELTPTPSDDLTIDELLTTFEQIIAQRASVLAEIVPPLTLTTTDRLMLVELQRREAAWQAALAAALRTVGEQRCGVHRLRAYAGYAR